jgi:hypothetical protein
MVEILQSGSVREEGIGHEHQHGKHTHTHTHPAGDQIHVHGWHSPHWSCSGDDTFGIEAEGPTEPRLAPAEWLKRLSDDLEGISNLVVMLPYVPGLARTEVVDEVLRQGAIVLQQDVSNTQFDYWELTRRNWASGEDFCYVEHDIMIPPGCIAGLDTCRELWCAHDYRLTADQVSIHNYTKGLAFGVVRFRKELTAKYPSLIKDLFFHSWTHLDGQVVNTLLALGESCHQHQPDAVHLHDYSPQAHAERQHG